MMSVPSFFFGRGGFGGFYLLQTLSSKSNNTRITTTAVEAASATTESTHHDHQQEQQSYNWNLSTEENYRSAVGEHHPIFVGEYIDIRQQLDQKYHATYTHARQLFQDAIIKSMLLSNSGATVSTSSTTSQESRYGPAMGSTEAAKKSI